MGLLDNNDWIWCTILYSSESPKSSSSLYSITEGKDWNSCTWSSYTLKFKWGLEDSFAGTWSAPVEAILVLSSSSLSMPKISICDYMNCGISFLHYLSDMLVNCSALAPMYRFLSSWARFDFILDANFCKRAIAEISIRVIQLGSMRVAASPDLPRFPERTETTFILHNISNANSGAWEIRPFRVDLFFQLRPFSQNGYKLIQVVLCSDNVTDGCYLPWLVDAFVPKRTDVMRFGPELRRNRASWTPWRYRSL